MDEEQQTQSSPMAGVQLTPQQIRNLEIMRGKLAEGFQKFAAAGKQPGAQAYFMPPNSPEQSETAMATNTPGCSGCPLGQKLKLIGGGLLIAGVIVGYLYFLGSGPKCSVEDVSI